MTMSSSRSVVAHAPLIFAHPSLVFMTFRPAARQPVAHCGTVTLNSVSATETHRKSERDFMFEGEARIGWQGALRFYKLFKVLYWSKVSSPSFTVAYVWTPSPLFLSLPFSRASIFSYPWGSRRRKCIDVAWRCVAYRCVAKLGVASTEWCGGPASCGMTCTDTKGYGILVV